MTRHELDGAIDAALRDLDPASVTTLTEAERQRADAAISRIMAAPQSTGVRAPRARRRRALVAVGLLGVSGAGISTLLLGGGSAFASWTPTPEPLPASIATRAADTCRAALGMPDHDERVVIAEQRGGWTYILLAGPRAEGACLMPDDLIESGHLADRKKDGFFGSYDTDPGDAPVLRSSEIVETESAGGTVSVDGRLPLTTDEGWFSSVSGHVGSDVVAVTVHPPGGSDVVASVEGGRFAAWWPRGENDSSIHASGEAWTYTVTLQDGTTERVADRR